MTPVAVAAAVTDSRLASLSPFCAGALDATGRITASVNRHVAVRLKCQDYTSPTLFCAPDKWVKMHYQRSGGALP